MWATVPAAKWDGTGMASMVRAVRFSDRKSRKAEVVL